MVVKFNTSMLNVHRVINTVRVEVQHDQVEFQQVSTRRVEIQQGGVEIQHGPCN